MENPLSSSKTIHKTTMSCQKLKPHSIHDAISPLHITGKLFGLTCFSFKSNKRAFVSFTDLFLILFAFWFHFSLLLYYSTRIVFKAENDSLIARTGYPMALTGSQCIGIIHIIGGILLRKNVAKFLEELDEIDEWVSLKKIIMHFRIKLN